MIVCCASTLRRLLHFFWPGSFQWILECTHTHTHTHPVLLTMEKLWEPKSVIVTIPSHGKREIAILEGILTSCYCGSKDLSSHHICRHFSLYQHQGDQRMRFGLPQLSFSAGFWIRTLSMLVFGDHPLLLQGMLSYNSEDFCSLQYTESKITVLTSFCKHFCWCLCRK